MPPTPDQPGTPEQPATPPPPPGVPQQPATPPPPQYGMQPGMQAGGQPGVPPAAGERPGELLDRFLARLIDGVIIGIAYGILSAIFQNIFLNDLFPSTGQWLVYWLVLTVIWVPLALGYFAYLDSTKGQTIGKMVLKLHVRGPNGGNPTMEQSVRRNIIYAFQLASIVPVLGSLVAGLAALVGVIMIAVGINSDPARRQAWHDRFAGGTYVVKTG